MKKILLTNDDGIDCKGIHVLAEELSKIAEVWIVAPDRNRSGVSHGITMFTPLTIKKLGERIFTCSGIPADCTITGIKGIMPVIPDVVISGINEGGNIGTDVLFSGTAAAARQAALYGIAGIAVSLSSSNSSWNYLPTACFIKNNLDTLMTLQSQDIFLNINTPSVPFKGHRFTTLSKRTYFDSLHTYNAPNGHTYTFFEGGEITTLADDSSDFTAVQQGYISISRVQAQPNAEDHTNFEHISFAL